MGAHVYRWCMRPGESVTLDLRVTASNVAIARRELHRFLMDHDGSTWSIVSVSREAPGGPDTQRTIQLGGPV